MRIEMETRAPAEKIRGIAKVHGESPTAHARRRVAAGQSRWLFCR